MRPGIAQERKQREQRDHRKILEQEHRERLAPVARGELLALRERRENESGGGHRQAEAGDQRSLPGEAERESQSEQRRAGREHLRAA